jgi:enamine deaminase RidA (YjgF/YER057c/UK114 family)
MIERVNPPELARPTGFSHAIVGTGTIVFLAGGDPAQLASMTIYVTDMDDYRANAADIGAVWRRLAGRDYPAMAGIGVARLWDREALVEVQGFAVLEG